jgi:hypothetical protein
LVKVSPFHFVEDFENGLVLGPCVLLSHNEVGYVVEIEVKLRDYTVLLDCSDEILHQLVRRAKPMILLVDRPLNICHFEQASRGFGYKAQRVVDPILFLDGLSYFFLCTVKSDNTLFNEVSVQVVLFWGFCEDFPQLPCVSFE